MTRAKAAKAPARGKKVATPAKLPAKGKRQKQIPLVERKSAKELRVERFVTEYMVDFNGKRAAIAAGYSPDGARQTASELLALPEVQERIQIEQAALLTRRRLDRESILSRFEAIALADPRELTELHRGACRFCWGEHHRYQRTPQEMRDARAKHQKDEAERQTMSPPPPPRQFEELGGVGFNPYRDPHPECPECFGRGEARVQFKDTRDVSPDAAQLFAGVEQTQHGLKIRMHSKTDALLHLGKEHGLFKTTVAGKVEHTHKGVSDILAELDGAETGPGPAR